jgi:hypothetical protein
MRPNFEVRPRAVAHLALAQGHPWIVTSAFTKHVSITRKPMFVKLK